jgi:hypothetical protein
VTNVFFLKFILILLKRSAHNGPKKAHRTGTMGISGELRWLSWPQTAAEHKQLCHRVTKPHTRAADLFCVPSHSCGKNLPVKQYGKIRSLGSTLHQFHPLKGSFRNKPLFFLSL